MRTVAREPGQTRRRGSFDPAPARTTASGARPLARAAGGAAAARSGHDFGSVAVFAGGAPAIHARTSPVVARQDGGSGQAREVPGPSPELPDAEKFDDAMSTPYGRGGAAAASTWGWGGQATRNLYHECSVAPMDRARFLRYRKTLPQGAMVPHRRNKVTEGPAEPLGSTWPDMQSAVAPRIAAEPVEEDGTTQFRLKPTHAEMPRIQSAYTQAGTFVEGSVPWADRAACPLLRGRAPLFWRITPDGAAKIRAGELEHCSDIRVAFDATLARYASMINNEAAAERRYPTERMAVEESKKRLTGIPLDPVDMVNECGREINKTRTRDTSGWHLGVTSEFHKPQENDCRGFLGVFDAKSFPEVGDGPGQEKHPPHEVMSP